MELSDILLIIFGQAALTFVISIGLWKLFEKIINTRIQSYLRVLEEKQINFSKEQFDVYKNCWQALIKLKHAADDAWGNVTNTTLYELQESLRATRKKIESISILVEKTHYDKLQAIIEKFDLFKERKNQLYRIKNKLNISQKEIDEIIKEYEITHGRTVSDQEIPGMVIVNINKNLKNEYNKLIEVIRGEFSKQLKG